MLDPQSAINGSIPAVDPADLERFWFLQSQHSPNSGISYCTRAISQICKSESADPVAIWARTALITIVLEQTELAAWRSEGKLQASVFRAAAAFPLPNGLQGVVPEAFLATLPV